MPAFVFLHAYDSGPEQGQRFVELGKEHVKHPLVLKLDCRFPAAPAKLSSAGRPVRLWYTVQARQEADGLLVVGEPVLVVERVAWLRGYINGLVAQGTLTLEIVVCGFRQSSQLLAAAVPLLEDMQLGGVAMIGGHIPVYETIEGWIVARGGPATLGNRDMPILKVHGCNDMHVEAGLQRKMDAFYELCGYHRYHTAEVMYSPESQHAITDEMWLLVWQFVLLVLGRSP